MLKDNIEIVNLGSRSIWNLECWRCVNVVALYRKPIWNASYFKFDCEPLCYNDGIVLSAIFEYQQRRAFECMSTQNNFNRPSKTPYVSFAVWRDKIRAFCSQDYCILYRITPNIVLKVTVFCNEERSILC